MSPFCNVVKPVGGRWREGSGWKEQRWQALPEWATDESTSDGGGKEKGKEHKTGSAVGSFDTSGNFTMSEVSECFCRLIHLSTTDGREKLVRKKERYHLNNFPR